MTEATAKQLLKRSGFKKATPTTKVTSIIAKLQSTHDAVFIFQGDQFLGIVNLYHSFLGKRVNPQQKVDACLYHPPVLAPETPAIEIARLMVESRIYRLPVLRKDQFLGVVFAEDLLRWARKLPLFKISIELNQRLFFTSFQGLSLEVRSPFRFAEVCF